MAEFSTFQLKGVKKTSNETYVEVTTNVGPKLYVLSKAKGDETFDKQQTANKDSLLLASGTIVHNMYDMDKLWYHSQAARRHKYPYADKYDYQHIYKKPATATALTATAKVGDTMYAIDRLDTAGHAYVNNEMYKWLLDNNGQSKPIVNPVETTLYDVATDDDGNQVGLSAKTAIIGAKYNTLYEIPGSIKQDYSKGELIANTFKTKNQYDAEWNMVEGTGNIVLDKARSYIGIGACGSTFWLKYKNIESYKTSSTKLSALPEYESRIENAVSVAIK